MKSSSTTRLSNARSFEISTAFGSISLPKIQFFRISFLALNTSKSGPLILFSTLTSIFKSPIGKAPEPQAGSKVLINVSIPVSAGTDSIPAGGQIIQTGTASATIMPSTEIMDEHHASSGGYFGGTFMSGVLSTAGSYTFSFQGNRLSGSSTVYFVSANPGSGSASIATMTLYEIAG